MNPETPYSSPVKEYSLESYVIDEDGQQVLDSKSIWKFNADNQVSEFNLQSSNKDYSEFTRYSYDENGRLKEVIVRVAEGEQKKALYYEYQDDLLFQVTEVAGDYKSLTKYDDMGSPAEKFNYTDGDLLISSTTYVNLYDKNGRLVEKHTIFPSGDADWINKYFYNESGRLVEEQKIRNGLVSTIKHQYNQRGDLVLSDFNPGETNYESLKREIRYAENNDILEIKEYRKGWCYQDKNDEFGLTGVMLYAYVR